VDQLPYLLAYVALAVFVIAVIARAVMWSKLPMHVRWELYPVAHEPPEKFEHGGSFMEDSEWWKQPRESSAVGELKVMIPEILFLVAVKEHNPKLWTRTFPFHFGLYLTIGATAIALLAGVIAAVDPSALAGGAAELVRWLVVVVGVVGFVLAIIGALGLLQRRLSVPSLRNYSAPADYFNLVFFVVAFGCGLVTFFLVDPDASKAMAFASNLVSFKFVAFPGDGIESLLPAASVVLLSLLVAYVPLTHMSHFVGKYFAYHAVRWNDEPNLAGGPQEAKIQAQLSQKVSWAADHIQGEGTKTWVDVALENPAVKEEK
jgi:nitrate reductase gamma subunit